MWKKNILNSNNDIIKTFQNKNNNNTLIKELYKYDKIKKIDKLQTNKTTLVEEFKKQITDLFTEKFDGHDNKFIKCIKPNMEKKENFFDEKKLLKQIKYLGIEAAFHIIKNGYPIKKKKEDFIKEYKLLFPEINIESFDEKIENEMKKIGNNEFNDLYKNGKKDYFFMKDNLKSSLNRILNEKLMENKEKIFNLIRKKSIKNIKKSSKKIKLFYGLKKYSDIIYKAKLKKLKNRFKLYKLRIKEKKEEEEKEKQEKILKEKEETEKEEKEKEEKEKENEEKKEEKKDNLFNNNQNDFNQITTTNNINKIFKDFNLKLEEKNNQFKKENEELKKKNEQLIKEKEEM